MRENTVKVKDPTDARKSSESKKRLGMTDPTRRVLNSEPAKDCRDRLARKPLRSADSQAHLSFPEIT